MAGNINGIMGEEMPSLVVVSLSDRVQRVQENTYHSPGRGPVVPALEPISRLDIGEGGEATEPDSDDDVVLDMEIPGGSVNQRSNIENSTNNNTESNNRGRTYPVRSTRNKGPQYMD